MSMKHPRPIATVRAGKWPQSPHGTTYIDIKDPITGASCVLELAHDQSGHGSMRIQMHNPEGAVHLCSPKQCVWSSQNTQDQADLVRLKYYRMYGRYPSEHNVLSPIEKGASDV